MSVTDLRSLFPLRRRLFPTLPRKGNGALQLFQPPEGGEHNPAAAVFSPPAPGALGALLLLGKCAAYA